jgi:hypothetical protein
MDAFVSWWDFHELAPCMQSSGVSVSALVAGLELTGFALGFAFQDVLDRSHAAL